MSKEEQTGQGPFATVSSVKAHGQLYAPCRGDRSIFGEGGRKADASPTSLLPG